MGNCLTLKFKLVKYKQLKKGVVMKDGKEKRPAKPVVNPPAAGGRGGYGGPPELLPDLRMEQRLHLTPQVRRKVNASDLRRKTMLPKRS